jgi:hypothetical protein
MPGGPIPGSGDGRFGTTDTGREGRPKERRADLIKTELWVELRSPGGDQGEVRPHERTAPQPEHHAGPPVKQLRYAGLLPGPRSL